MARGMSIIDHNGMLLIAAGKPPPTAHGRPSTSCVLEMETRRGIADEAPAASAPLHIGHRLSNVESRNETHARADHLAVRWPPAPKTRQRKLPPGPLTTCLQMRLGMGPLRLAQSCGIAHERGDT